MSKINRRQAIRTLIGAVGVAATADFGLPHQPVWAIDASTAAPIRPQTQATPFPVPPSLMLHSEHGTNTGDINGFLPVLVRRLQDDGYQGLTYGQWLALAINHDAPPAKPVLISIDDLTMAQGGPTFETFAAMRATLLENGFPMTFAVVNRLDLPQDQSRWATVRGWVEQGGVELATHTDGHVNFNKKDGSPRDDFDTAAYSRQITLSALHIQAATGTPVQTLITPFGSGFQRSTQQIHPAIVEQCQRVGIKLVVGIPDGRTPIAQAVLADSSAVVYVGRTEPPNSNNTAFGAMYELNSWYEKNYAPLLAGGASDE